MAATLSYQLKNAPAEFFDGIRWPILTLFVLHANIRNRVWMSQRTLATRLGKSVPYVNAALHYLEAHGAITLVPRDKLVDEELKVPARQHVYQLTGALTFGEKTIAYLYIPKTRRVDDQPHESSKITPVDHQRRVNDQPDGRSTPVNLTSIESGSESSLDTDSEKQKTSMQVVSAGSAPQVDLELKLMLFAILKVTGLDYRLLSDVTVTARNYLANGYTADDVAAVWYQWRDANQWKLKTSPTLLPKLEELTAYLGRSKTTTTRMRYDMDMTLEAIIRRVRISGDFAAIDPEYELALESGERLALAG